MKNKTKVKQIRQVKFTKGDYEVMVSNDFDGSILTKPYKEKRTGFLSDNFAVHYKDKDKMFYTVTHLNTGYRVMDFDTMAQAKDFMKQAETIPDIDTMNLSNSKDFAQELKFIGRKIRYARK